MRCDLHVHSKFSGDVNLPVLRHLGRECYSEPEEAHETARRRGMTLVTLTDHDTIDGALRLAGRPDFFVSEEVSCDLPGGRTLHLGVYDIEERHHGSLQARRGDPEAMFAFLAEEAVPFAINHLFSALTGPRQLADLHLALAAAPLVEAPNGMMPPATNAYAAAAGRAAGRALVGGSDAHALDSIASAFTVVPGAATREEFLAGLRQGRTLAQGNSGSYARLTRDVVRVFSGGYVENARDARRNPRAALRLLGLLAGFPVLALLPAVTALIYLRERAFAQHWQRQMERAGHASRPERWGAPAVGEA
jgi:predicted metal-dependent phosphoesterase TrpH